MHALIALWFSWLKIWGYFGVVVLMALESTVLPVPSELVVPPAAFWAAQGQFNFWGVVLSAILGSYLGSILSYGLMRWAKDFIVRKFGGVPFVSDEKMKVLEAWVKRFGVPGVFFARMLPVVRHLISLPAGLFKMDFIQFSAATLIGSAFWCYVLALFGEKIIGPHPELMNSPEEMIAAVRTEAHGFLGAIIGFLILYIFVEWIRRRVLSRPASQSR